jgi:hypothetical protein
VSREGKPEGPPANPSPKGRDSICRRRSDDGGEDRGEWRGSPLDAGGIDPYGIKEIIVEYDTGDEEILKPRLRDEYGAYELQQAAVYLGTLAGELRRSADM